MPGTLRESPSKGGPMPSCSAASRLRALVDLCAVARPVAGRGAHGCARLRTADSVLDWPRSVVPHALAT